MTDINITREKIQSNLFSFYQILGAKSGYCAGKNGTAICIANEAFSWPSFVLGGGRLARNSLLEIFKGMEEGRLPGTWIRQTGEDPDFERLAALHCVRKANEWYGMHLLRRTKYNFPAPATGYTFEEVSTLQDLKDWLKVVNLEVLPENKLDINCFLNILQDPEFRLFRIRNGKKTVSTILVYLQGSICGIYMVSTILNQRQKGLGRWITTTAIDLIIEKGNTEFVLHATPEGYPLYYSLGFQEYSKFEVYCMEMKK